MRQTGPEEMTASHLLSRTNDSIQASSSAAAADGGGGGEDGFSNGGVEVHHHCFWPFELLQLLQEMHPLLHFLG